ncbi:hypothetical protein H5398_15470 [Tessaracoccus sp. MC1679]|uniref:hypothetical protein n=1 Tax=Tessaracoccus sp. MC1679 TaxID=2760313 RepID=UPI0016035C6D|nr:hypothetical protein [Tessaracoccus sp. MC1679]MBB1517354.1 hypothetical protein [Tessaracoccus sp. MC1679]
MPPAVSPRDLAQEGRTLSQQLAQWVALAGVVTIASLVMVISKLVAYFRGNLSKVVAVLDRADFDRLTYMTLMTMMSLVAIAVLLWAPSWIASSRVSYEMRFAVAALSIVILIIYSGVLPWWIMVWLPISYLSYRRIEMRLERRIFEPTAERLELFGARYRHTRDIELRRLARVARTSELMTREERLALYEQISRRVDAVGMPWTSFSVIRYTAIASFAVMAALFPPVFSAKYLVSVEGNERPALIVRGQWDALLVDPESRDVSVVRNEAVTILDLCGREIGPWYSVPLDARGRNGDNCGA